MSAVEVLVLNGSPGSGKSTVANVISELLRQSRVPHAVIDVDELCRVFPETGMDSLKWRNLAAIWPNTGRRKVLLPVLIDSAADLAALRAATGRARLAVCELVAAHAVLSDRVTRREPNAFWQVKLRTLVDRYQKRDGADKFHDFQMRTDDKTVEEAANQIVAHLGWSTLAAPDPPTRGIDGRRT